MRMCVAWATLVMMFGCGKTTNPTSDGGPSDAAAATIDAPTAIIDATEPDASAVDAAPTMGAVDVLFVIDNSGSMAEEQAALVNGFASFVNVLQSVFGSLPSLHIGVVSTDLGAGAFAVPTCTGNGDNGRLQATPTTACNGPTGAFIQDVANPDGSRTTNYTGTLAETFSCIAPLGIDGCGFEQPLESMKRALNGSQPGNAGFLRPHAVLAVIIISDEDDCSTENTQMFDPNPSEVLGPLSSFRCFEFGVVCNPDEPRTPGVKSDCQVRTSSPYMYGVQPYIDFLVALKGGHTNRVVVGAITAPDAPINVVSNKLGDSALQPSCTSAAGQGAPAVRLRAFASGFGTNAHQSSICAPSYGTALEAIAMKIAAAL